MWSAERARLLRAVVLGCLALVQVAAAPADEPLRLRQAEAKLLNLRVHFRGVLSARTLRPAQPAPALVTVLHLWSVDCRACVEELTWFRSMVQAYRRDPRVRFVFLSETAEQRRLLDFLARHQDEIPALEHYKNGDDIRGILQNATQPLTLLLDERLVVRQAFVGSISEDNRRPEVVDAIRRLLRAME